MDEQNKKQGEEANEQFNNSDNEYGLPEAEYSPIKREQPLAPEQSEPVYFSPKESDEEPQRNSSWPMWVALGVILLLSGVFLYIFVFDEEPQEPVVQQTESENTFIVEESTPEPVEEPEADAWETSEPEVLEGSVSTISSRTGRYYLIVGSFIDGDLANDYAKKLADEGTQAKIIEPAGTRKFYRLSVKDAESISALNSEMDSMKSKFGENIWIVKY